MFTVTCVPSNDTILFSYPSLADAVRHTAAEDSAKRSDRNIDRCFFIASDLLSVFIDIIAKNNSVCIDYFDVYA